MSDEVAEVLSLVEKAQAKGKFNLSDAIKGLANPTDSVEVYLDIYSAYELAKLNEKLINEPDIEISKELEAKAEELAEKIKASRLVFNMRGVDQNMVESLEASYRAKFAEKPDEMWVEYMCALVAENIVSVEDADGNIDDHDFTAEEVMVLRASMPKESWEQVLGTMQKLTLATGYFKGLTDAGFLQKS